VEITASFWKSWSSGNKIMSHRFTAFQLGPFRSRTKSHQLLSRPVSVTLLITTRMPSTTSTPSRAKSSPRQEPLSPTESDDRLNALLSPPTGVDRSPRDIALGLKRIRELILTDGMPELVRTKSRPLVL